MKIGPIEIHWRRPRPIIQVKRVKELSEDQINRAFAVPESNEMLQALLQLIETGEDLASDNAAATMFSDIGMAGYVGGNRHLRLLRDDIIARRALGLNAMEKELQRR